MHKYILLLVEAKQELLKLIEQHKQDENKAMFLSAHLQTVNQMLGSLKPQPSIIDVEGIEKTSENTQLARINNTCDLNK